MAYDGGGLKALKSRPSGGRKRENMTLVEENALLARFAKAAGAGEMLNHGDSGRPARRAACAQVTKQQAADGSISIARSDIYHGGRVSFVPFTRLEGDLIKGTPSASD